MTGLQLEIVRHFISGEGLFSAILCILLAVLWRWVKAPGGETVVWLLVLVGISLLFLSSSFVNSGTAISVIVTIGWLLAGAPPKKAEPEAASQKRHRKTDLMFHLAVVVLWGFEGGLELVWRQSPDFTSVDANAAVIVLGDSLSADDPDSDVPPWPDLLQETGTRPVQNLSEIGATLSSALNTIPDSFPEDSLILVELGGNDLLGSTTAQEFREQLEALLQKLGSYKCTVALFELPLPPFKSEFGRAQRELAKKYRVKLIPKRILSRVIVSPETTVDSLHLSPAGHERLASDIQALLTK